MERDNRLSNAVRRGRVGLRTVRRSEWTVFGVTATLVSIGLLPITYAAEAVFGTSMWVEAISMFVVYVAIGAGWAVLLEFGRWSYAPFIEILRTSEQGEIQHDPRLIVVARLAGQLFPHAVRRFWEPVVEEVLLDIRDVAHRAWLARLFVCALHAARLGISFAVCIRIWGFDRTFAAFINAIRHR